MVCFGWVVLNPQSEIPLYRQLFEQIAVQIRTGQLERGERLPPTRELAGQLGLNRTTISAAYELLEAEGLIAGQVGRGSFVTGEPPAKQPGRPRTVNWGTLLDRGDSFAMTGAAMGREISFVMSRPSRELFPLDDFRASCEAVLSAHDLADILQLGSPSGYEPLRRYLLEEARAQNLAAPGDDLMITNGCQQALDLIGRVLLRPGDTVAVEDPVYPGLKNLLSGMGAQLAGIPVGADGMDIAQLERVLERERPRLLVVTSNFQNPTGRHPAGGFAPRAADRCARAKGVPVVENDAYGELRYEGEPVPAIKQLDDRGGTVLLRSFSKVSFPGLRVGWALGPKPLIDRMRQAKEASDLHTDQLSQAVLLEFAESGRLAAHRARVLEAGARAAARDAGCLPRIFARRHALDASAGRHERLGAAAASRWTPRELLPRAQKEGVAYLPGRYFAVSRQEPGALRLSFAGLPPEEIRRGVAVLGESSRRKWMRRRRASSPRRRWFERLRFTARRRGAENNDDSPRLSVSA